MPDYRKEERKGVGYQVFLLVDGKDPVSCCLLDISNGGACLFVGKASDIPDRVGMQLSQRGARRECQVMWRRNGQIGVKFDKSTTPASGPSERAEDKHLT